MLHQSHPFSAASARRGAIAAARRENIPTYFFKDHTGLWDWSYSQPESGYYNTIHPTN
jgi:hypothetical protein